MAELPANAVGWVNRQTKEALDPYAWIVRCPKHPPAPKSAASWEPLTLEECPPEVPGCEECGEFLT
jgi:hypothetical protein